MYRDRQLSIISGQLRKRNFIYRMLFYYCFYSRAFIRIFYLYFDLVQMRSVILCNKRICMYAEIFFYLPTTDVGRFLLKHLTD